MRRTSQRSCRRATACDRPEKDRRHEQSGPSEAGAGNVLEVRRDQSSNKVASKCEFLGERNGHHRSNGPGNQPGGCPPRGHVGKVLGEGDARGFLIDPRSWLEGNPDDEDDDSNGDGWPRPCPAPAGVGLAKNNQCGQGRDDPSGVEPVELAIGHGPGDHRGRDDRQEWSEISRRRVARSHRQDLGRIINLREPLRPAREGN